MLKSVKILDGQSRYNVFSVWQKALRKAFLEMEVNAEIVHAYQDFSCPPETKTVTLSFNLVRKWSVENGNQHHIAWIVDHPAYHPDFFSPAISGMTVNRDKLIVGFADRAWVKFAQEIYQYPDVVFVPHAAVSESTHPPDSAKRDIDIVFFGSIDPLESLHTKLKKESANLWPLLEKLMNEFSYSAPGRLDTLMWNILKQVGMNNQNALLAVNAFFSTLNWYHVCKERINTLRSIKSAKVHLFGTGPWKEMGLGNNIVIHENIPYDKVINVMKRARLILNHMPGHQDGGHERIFEALANGCGVLTTPSYFIHSEFGENKGIKFYPGSQANMDELIAPALSDPAAEECITAGQQLVAERHHMRNRAELIAQLAAERWPDVFA